MVNAFSKGNNYTDVWYGEYVIIDTANKNHKDNGKIFRRGLDYQNSMGGAEYIGQVVGPSSGTPYFEITTMEDVIKNHATMPYDDDIVYKRYPSGKDENGCYIVEKGGDGSNIGTFDFDTTNCLVPGKIDGKSEWNDTIRYTWVNIRDDTNEADSWFYVGFQIPYTVIDYYTHSVSPYNTSGNYEDLTKITRVDDRTHPFWENWQVDIPKAVKGDCLKNFRVTTLADETQKGNPVYNVSAISQSWNTSKLKFETTVNKNDLYVDNDHKNLNNPNLLTDATGESTNTGPRKILVLDYVVYDNKSGGESYTIFIGDYNMITGVNVDDDGTVRVQMTHDNEYVYEQRIHWIDLIGLTTGNGAAGGHFTFTWNYYKTAANGTRSTEKDTTEFDISWLKTIAIEQDGTLIYTYAGVPETENLPKDLNGNPATKIAEGVYKVDDFLRWVTEVDLNPENGHFTVTTNTDRDGDGQNDIIFETDLNWVKFIKLDQDGTIHFIHTIPVADNAGRLVDQNPTSEDEYYSNAIKWINEVSLKKPKEASAGEFRIKYNYGPDYVVQLDWIYNIELDDDGTLHLWHTENDRDENYPNKIKWVNNVRLNSTPKQDDSGEFRMKFNYGSPDTDYVAQLDWIYKIILDEDGTLHFMHMQGDEDEEYTNILQWITRVSLNATPGTPNAGEFRVEFNNNTPDYVVQLDWIYKIELDADGTIHFHHIEEDEDEYYRYVVKWITNVSLNSTPGTDKAGEFRISFNNNDPDYYTQLDWIYKIVLDDDGTIHFYHIENDRDEYYDNIIKWITEVSLNTTPNQSDSGEFRISFNNGDADYTAQLDWIDDIYIDEESGEIAIHHMESENNTDTAKNEEPAEILDAKLKLIISADVNDDGILEFHTNTGETITLNEFSVEDDEDDSPYHFKKVEDIRLKTELTDDKHIQIKYNTKDGDPEDAEYTDDDYVMIGDPINYIQDMVVRTTDWHLLVLYNDPEHRATQDDLDPETMRDENGNLWVNNIEGSDGETTSPSIYWRDLGTIKDQHGLLIGFNVTEDEVAASPQTNIIDYLNAKYPQGLTEEDNQPNGEAIKQKIVTYSKNDTDNKEFYAFDYLLYKWYSLGRITEKWDARMINESEHSQSDVAAVVDTLALDGLMFISHTVEYSTTAIPRFWAPDQDLWEEESDD